MTVRNLTRQIPNLSRKLDFLKFSSLKIPTQTLIQFSKEEKIFAQFNNCLTMSQISQLHSHLFRSGLTQNLFLIGKVIAFCAASESGDMNYALKVFRDIDVPDGFLWNTVIRGFERVGDAKTAVEWYKIMLERKVLVDNFTICNLLKVCGSVKNGFLGMQMHCCAVRYGLEGHEFVRNGLIHMYGVLGEIGAARQVFDEITVPDLVSWNTVIDCCVSCGAYGEGIKLFEAMVGSGAEPDEVTVVVTLSACSAIGAVDIGRRVHSWVDGLGLCGDVGVCNSLIDMYAKCGEFETAKKVFNEMRGRNIVSWNAMISGVAMNGHGDAALDLFSKMLEGDMVRPDEVTFLAVLCACNHSGMVEQGKRYFDSMTKDYGLKPTIKHYGCMVDILSRAGFLGEAYQLIQSMPMECNAIVWRTLLSACRVYGEVKLGETVRKHLAEIEPDHSSDYVLLANMYADAEKWSKMAKLRKSMKNKRVRKPEPGSSSMVHAIF